MALPIGTFYWSDQLDPSDVDFLTLDCSPFLLLGEKVTSFSINILADAALLGLSMGTNAYQSRIVENSIVFWPVISGNMQNNAAFIQGAYMPLEFTINTDFSPSRKIQRTAAFRVVQQ